MRARNAWFLGGIAVVALGASAYVLTRGSDGSVRKGGPPQSGHGSAVATREGARDIPPPRRGTGSAIVRDTDTARPVDPGTGGVDLEFEREVRDEPWSSDAEAEVRRRLEPLAAMGADVSEVSCRTSRCRLTIEGRGGVGLTEALARMGEPGMVEGFASQMIQGAVDQVAPDHQRTTVYLLFER